jgi:hypothetical protein
MDIFRRPMLLDWPVNILVLALPPEALRHPIQIVEPSFVTDKFRELRTYHWICPTTLPPRLRPGRQGSSGWRFLCTIQILKGLSLLA